ncbi:MAG TPA: hypothetical protein VEY89_08220, partial [Candidatus Dormibacteraeota bacterium]|nr:hypothetical protein [Candidatus Dormibacteraeota bacterium]
MRTRPEDNRVRPGAAAAITAALWLSACTGGLMSPIRGTTTPPAAQPPSVSATVLSEYLLLLQRLVQGSASEQAEILATARNEYGTAPTPSRELRLALILA